MTVIDKIENYGEYDEDTLKHFKEVQLIILKDFIEICEKYNIPYFVSGGTLLGAVRHKGFIPWDDDIDIDMFREDHDKFLEVMKTEKTDKYEIITVGNLDYYPFFFTLMSLKGTKVKYPNEKKITKGINIEIFILDDIPSNKILWKYIYKKMKFLKRFGYLLYILENDFYISNFKEKLGHTIKFFFKVFHINYSTFVKSYYKTLDKLVNAESDEKCVYDLGTHEIDCPMPKNKLFPQKKMQFESMEVCVPNDYDWFLTFLYGDYMKLPPEDKRKNHCLEIEDFGKY